jgi:hypothetical protein
MFSTGQAKNLAIGVYQKTETICRKPPISESDGAPSVANGIARSNLECNVRLRIELMANG